MLKSRYKNQRSGCNYSNKLMGNNTALLIAGETTCEGLLLDLEDADETSDGGVGVENENEKYVIY